MHPDPKEDLKIRVQALGLEWHKDHYGPFSGATSQEVVRMLQATATIAYDADANLHRWVDVARQAGMTWSEIGAAIGMSQQAATQRFGRKGRDPGAAARDNPEIRVKGANLFNESQMLADEGRRGRELVRLEPMSLILIQTDRPWEHTRLFGLPAEAIKTDAAADGWEYVSSYGPFHYFKRPLNPLEPSAR